jgi:hypothetical protein
VPARRVFFAGADGVVRALSTTSGAPVRKSEIGSPVWTALVVVSDALCFGTRDGLENVPAAWKARETCEVIWPDGFIETFELAQGERPYEPYSRTRFRRVRGR